jgi:hypothetical protein
MTKHGLMLLAVTACAAGCTPVYSVHVNAFSEIKEPLSQATPIYVARDPASPNPILADAIAAKIRALLEERGYTATEKPEGAIYTLTFRAGIDYSRVMDYLPVARPYGGFYGFYGGGYHGFGYGYTTYVPYIETVYVHWMEMRLFAPGQSTTDRSRPIWIGEAVVGRSDAEMRESANYLVPGLMEFFAADTRRWVHVRLKENDPRVEGIAGVQ